MTASTSVVGSGSPDQLPLPTTTHLAVHSSQGEGDGWTADRKEMQRRLLAKSVAASNGCRLWTRELNSAGYGKLNFHGQKVLAHRAAIYVATGEWPPPWLLAMHSCDVRPCIAEAHLSLGSPRDNVADAVARGRAGRGLIGHCIKGHPYDDERRPAARDRRCRPCDEARRTRENESRRRRYDPDAERQRKQMRKAATP